MTATKSCPECGKELPPDAPAGLCPVCLLNRGRGTGSKGGTAESEPRPTSPLSAHFDPPTAQELAPLFPTLDILELIGKGGMGAVYKARQPHLDRLIAVKILPPQVSEIADFAERFTREARALARLSHPNIVAVYDFGEAEGLYYFLMEYVDGANIRQLTRQGGLKPREALAVVPQICDALQYAHDEGIVHRDIKPENILVDKKGRVQIADFGLAKLVGKGPEGFTLTATEQVMGTPHYMAPEQMKGSHAVDHRADIYSLGVVFYEMLTGELPVGKFEPPSAKVHIDARLDEVVLRALESEPQRRYQHASDVKTDVNAISSGIRPDVDSGSASQQTVTSFVRRATDQWSIRVATLMTAFLVGYLGYRLFLPDVSGAVWSVVVVLALLGFLVDVFRHPGKLKGLQAGLPFLAGVTAVLVYLAVQPQTMLRWLEASGAQTGKDDSTFLRIITGAVVAWLIWQMVQVSKRIKSLRDGQRSLQEKSAHNDSHRPPSTLQRALTKWWAERDRWLTGTIKALLQVVCVVGVLIFFSSHGSGGPGEVAYEVGAPTPWYTFEYKRGEGYRGFVKFDSLAWIALGVGAVAYLVWWRIRKVESAPPGRFDSPRAYAVVVSIFALIAMSLGLVLVAVDLWYRAG